MSEELDGLIAAVGAKQYSHEIGSNLFSSALPTVRGVKRFGHAVNANSGSLDAAKSLHEILLPGWNVQRIFGPYPKTTLWVVEIKKIGGRRSRAMSDDPARAWLLAILKAYRASRTTEGDAS